MQRWQIGTTKVFMKEDVKTVLESVLGAALLDQVKEIQRVYKGFKARKLYKRMFKADRVIKANMKKWIVRRRFRKAVMKMIERVRNSIKVIKRVVKRQRRIKLIMKEINLRIQTKK